MARRTIAAAAAISLAAFVGEAAASDGTRPLYRAQAQAQALYRQGQPPVLRPAPAPAPQVAVQVAVPSPQIRDAFRTAYRRAGSPRLAVFWNRVFSDGLRDMEAGNRIVIETSSARASGGADKTYSDRQADRVVIKSESRAGDGSRASPVTEIGEFRFQAGYLQPLIREGAGVIDRAAIMRITDADRRMRDSAVPLDDRQLIETAALKDHADLLIQIALSPSAESKTGAFFHVNILEVETGRIRASFFHDGTFPEPPPRKVWKAVEGGYIQVTEKAEPAGPVIDLERMGRILSEETMIALAGL